MCFIATILCTECTLFITSPLTHRVQEGLFYHQPIQHPLKSMATCISSAFKNRRKLNVILFMNNLFKLINAAIIHSHFSNLVSKNWSSRLCLGSHTETPGYNVLTLWARLLWLMELGKVMLTCITKTNQRMTKREI